MQSFGMTGARQPDGLLRIERQIGLPGADQANASVERGDGQLGMLAMHPFDVTGLADHAQQNMVRHAGGGVAGVEPAARAACEAETDLRDVLHLSPRQQVPTSAETDSNGRPVTNETM